MSTIEEVTPTTPVAVSGGDRRAQVAKHAKLLPALTLLGIVLVVVQETVNDTIAAQRLQFPVDGRQSMLNVPSAPAEGLRVLPRPSDDQRCKKVWDAPHTRLDLWNISEDRYVKRGCPRRPSIRCTGRKPKALVVYMLHTRDSPHDMQPEMWNLNYFVQYGILGASQSTEMFERVDYVFTRMMPVGLKKGVRVDRPQLCAEEGNIKLLWVPEGPCDLCAHHRVLEYLGGVERIKKKYAYLVYLNAGTRGPFQALDDPAWIDVLAMSGYNVWDAKNKPAPVMTGPTVSTAHSIHVQSFFVGVHTSALDIVDSYLNRCSNSKNVCIYEGEVPVGAAFIDAGGWMHSLSRNVTIRCTATAVAKYAALQRYFHPTNSNPMTTTLDVCAAMFIKHGGTLFRGIQGIVAAQASQLTLHQPAQRTLAGGATFRALLSRSRFIRL